MRYDRADGSFRFGTERVLSGEIAADLIDESRKRLYDKTLHSQNPEYTYKGPIPEEAARDGAPDDTGSKRMGIGQKVLGVLMVLTVLAVVVTVILAVIRRDLVLFGYVMSTVVCLMGIGTAVSESDDVSTSSSLRFSSRLSGSVFFLVGAYILVLLIIRNTIPRQMLFSLLAVGGFLLIGLWFLITGFMNALADKFIYKEEKEAVCTGFVHTVSFRKGATIKGSPVFSYDMDGIKYESIYDFPVKDIDETIEAGQSTVIRIIPDDPSCVWNEIRGGGAYLMIFAIPFLAVAVMLISMMATGAV